MQNSGIACELARTLKAPVTLAQCDLYTLSRLHGDFVADCLDAISQKRERLGSPLVGELFPHLVAQSIAMPDRERRMLSAAWLALYGYISLVDYRLDKFGHLDARASMSSSAVLGWGLSVLSEAVHDTRFASIYHENVRRAFSAQYTDLTQRQNGSFDRSQTDIDKNRAILAAISGYCAAGNEKDDRLLLAAEQMLGPFQLLDDLADLQEDLDEGNATTLARIVRELMAVQKVGVLSPYKYAFGDVRLLSALIAANDAVEKAVLILRSGTDNALISFLLTLSSRMKEFCYQLGRYQRGESSPCCEDLQRQVHEIFCHS